MIIGVPKEIKAGERRVSMTPQGVDALVAHHHRVLVEKGAGEGSGFSDKEYLKAGAILVDKKKEVWAEAEMVVKVKEPLQPEFTLMKPGQVLFTYLHLAADRDLTLKLVERRIVGIGYETVQERDGSLPLLRPMSEIAGRSSSLREGCVWRPNTGEGASSFAVPRGFLRPRSSSSEPGWPGPMRARWLWELGPGSAFSISGRNG